MGARQRPALADRGHRRLPHAPGAGRTRARVARDRSLPGAGDAAGPARARHRHVPAARRRIQQMAGRRGRLGLSAIASRGERGWADDPRAVAGLQPVVLRGDGGAQPWLAVVGTDRATVLAGARTWSRLVLAGLRLLCGIDYVVTGRENLPAEGAALVAPMHQSAFDTILWLQLVPECVYVLKRELTQIPRVRWAAAEVRHDRGEPPGRRGGHARPAAPGRPRRWGRAGRSSSFPRARASRRAARSSCSPAWPRWPPAPDWR